MIFAIRTSIRDYGERIYKSPLIRFTTRIACAALAYRLYASHPKSLAAKVLVVLTAGYALVQSIFCRKYLIYEISMIWTMASNKWNGHKWVSWIINEGDNCLYLGALPLIGQNLCMAHKYISIIEPWEREQITLVSRPNSFGNELIEASDYGPLTIEQLDKAADQINDALKTGSVYVHCKAGRGRSAMAVIAYLIKHRDMLYIDAHAHLKTHRPQVNMNASQADRMQEYAEHLKTRQSS